MQLTQDSPIVSTPTKQLHTEGEPAALGFTIKEAMAFFGDITPRSSAKFVAVAAREEVKAKASTATDSYTSPQRQQLLSRQAFLMKRVDNLDLGKEKKEELELVIARDYAQKHTNYAPILPKKQRAIDMSSGMAETTEPAATSPTKPPLQKQIPASKIKNKNKTNTHIVWNNVPSSTFHSLQHAQDSMKENFPTLFLRATLKDQVVAANKKQFVYGTMQDRHQKKGVVQGQNKSNYSSR